MNRLVCVLFALACALVPAASAMAQSAGVTGDWDVPINSPQGACTATVSFKQEGEKLTGVFKSQRSDISLEGTIKGKEIKFKYTVKFQDQDLAITLSGAVDGDSMKGDADFGGFAQGDWSGKRASAAASSSAPAAAPASSGNKGDVTRSWDGTGEAGSGSRKPSLTLQKEGEKTTRQHQRE